MAEIIKGNSLFNTIIIDGEVEISNKIASLDDVKQEASEADAENEEEQEEEEEEERFTVNFEELEDLKEKYRKEGEEQAQNLLRRSEKELSDAKAEAADIVEKARVEAAQALTSADKEIKYRMNKAEREGFEKGFDDGMRKGAEHGYTAGIRQCTETLEDLNRIIAEYGREKDALMTENRRVIFDLALSIAEKITLTTFTQKSKNVLEKMIASAAKEFRKAKNIKVTLSKLDITEEIIADSEILQKCFPQTATVEYELLDNAERGTLLIEGDSEILDAGVSTQLKMIEELGKGKFREKEPDKPEDKPDSDAVPQEKHKKKKPNNSDTVIEDNPEPVSEPDEPVGEPQIPIDEQINSQIEEQINNQIDEQINSQIEEQINEQINGFAENPEADAAEEAAIEAINNAPLEITENMSETELADAADAILAQAGLDIDVLDSEDDMELSSVSSISDKITLTKTPLGSDDSNEGNGDNEENNT